jgi:urease accessory protein
LCRENQEINSPQFNLDLSLERSCKKTFLRDQFSCYPFHICKPHYLDESPAGLATIYLQSSAGGIFSGDTLNARFKVGPGSQAHVTSQASTVVHTMKNSGAKTNILIRVGEQALFEYLPDPLILFPKANLAARLHLEIDESSTVLLCDSYLTHDPYQSGGYFSQLANETTITDKQGSLLCLDRSVIEGRDFAQNEIGIMGARRVVGTFYYINRSTDSNRVCELLNNALGRCSDIYAGVSTLPNKIGAWARIIATDVAPLREAVDKMWRASRADITGYQPAASRK